MTQTAAARDSTACGADAAMAADLPAPSDAGCPESAPASRLHCELQASDRIRICAADAKVAGLRGDYKRSRVELPDLQREETLGCGWQGGRYMVQAGWAAVMEELGLSQGMWVTLTMQDGYVRSIQKRAGPADTAPSPLAVPLLVASTGPDGHSSEQEQQPPQRAAAEPGSGEVYVAGASSRKAAQPSTQSAVPTATAQLGSILFTIHRPQRGKSGQRLPKAQAQAAFNGYRKQHSNVSVPMLRRKFTVIMGWACDRRFALGQGWPQLMTEVGLRHGDRVRLSMTGDASFKLDIGLDAADMAGQDAANESQGAQLTGIQRSCLAGGFRVCSQSTCERAARLCHLGFICNVVDQGLRGCRCLGSGAATPGHVWNAPRLGPAAAAQHSLGRASGSR